MVIYKSILSAVCLSTCLIQTVLALSTDPLSKRIINGFELDQDIVKGAALINKDVGDDYTVMCGGTIISPRHVLTVSHCIVDKNGVVAPARNFTIGYNNKDRTAQYVSRGTKVTLVDPEYITVRDMHYDMAILEIEEIKLGNNTQRVPIFNGHISENQPILTVGWGLMETGELPPHGIRGAILYTGNQTLCQGDWAPFEDNNGPMVCAPATLSPQHGVCSGDSGSGVFLNKDGVLMLIGTTSSMTDPNGDFCTYNEGASLYTRAGYYLDVISEATGLSKEYLTGLSNDI